MATETELLAAARRRRDEAVWEANDRYAKDVAAIRAVAEMARREPIRRPRSVAERLYGLVRDGADAKGAK